MSEPDLVAGLSALRERFLRNAVGRLEELARALDAAAQDPTNTAATDRLIHVAHNLAGLGGTYGFPRVSEIARELTNQARDAAGSPDTIRAQLSAWREAHAQITEELTIGVAPPAPAAPPPATAEKTIVLCVLQDKATATTLAANLAQSIEIVHVNSVAAAIERMRAALPDVVVAECHLDDGSGTDVVKQLRALPGGDDVLAVVAGTGKSDAIRKVEILRSGADSLLTEQTPDAILRRLNVLLDRRRAATPRILSIEDDPDQAAYLATVLSSAGYAVRVCDDPAMFESDLQSFRPDLLLMDVDLPGVSGDELARSVRQSDELATLPIVFLTGDAQPSSRLRTAKSGGDDFLTKPVSPALLLATIAARVERSRHLAALFERDGVTGLLTHAVFFDKLHALWQARERSQSEGTALVIIDLDHFKRVNDRYGHLSGDRVLASFGALARRSLRTLDLIGRYGGEEFALVVTDVTAAEAVALADRLREEFSTIEQQSIDGSSFHVTFSAGLAMLSNKYASIEEWIGAADAALYRAKAGGRNRVEGA